MSSFLPTAFQLSRSICFSHSISSSTSSTSIIGLTRHSSLESSLTRRPFSALAATLPGPRPHTAKIENYDGDRSSRGGKLFLRRAEMNDWINRLSPPLALFHTSVFNKLMGNPKSLIYDLDPQEPRKPEEWEFRHVRYGKSKKEWRLKIPMGRPVLSAIPEGHVDRAGNPYTSELLPWEYTQGCHPVTGRRTNFAVGPGVRRFYRMLDLTRNVPVGEPSPFVERVLEVVRDETRTPFLALVVNGNFKRWTLASENMKAGDLIKTYNEIPRNPVQAYEGDAYPVGALAPGTIVHNVETQPGKGGIYATHAGQFGTVVRREGDRVIICMHRLKKSKAVKHDQEISVDERCMSTVGRVSNVNHHLIPIGSAPMLIKLGWRAQSGWFQKKDGRFGRKIRPPADCRVFELEPRPYTPIYKNK